MAKLKAGKRRKLKKSQFGLPGSKKYPMPDNAHARNAKARAKQQFNKGELSKASYSKVAAKADRVLGKKGK